jgi:hypothetical protein
MYWLLCTSANKVFAKWERIYLKKGQDNTTHSVLKHFTEGLSKQRKLKRDRRKISVSCRTRISSALETSKTFLPSETMLQTTYKQRYKSTLVVAIN